jgi:hypothetical protein
MCDKNEGGSHFAKSILQNGHKDSYSFKKMSYERKLGLRRGGEK